jgi:hypothetical protein
VALGRNANRTLARNGEITPVQSASHQFDGSRAIRELVAINPFAGTDPTMTSGPPVIRGDQRLLWGFGKLRAARVSALQNPPLLHPDNIV